MSGIFGIIPIVVDRHRFVRILHRPEFIYRISDAHVNRARSLRINDSTNGIIDGLVKLENISQQKVPRNSDPIFNSGVTVPQFFTNSNLSATISSKSTYESGESQYTKGMSRIGMVDNDRWKLLKKSEFIYKSGRFSSSMK